MKLTVNAFITLDGVMQGPGADDEDPSGGFDRGGWLVPHVDEDFGEIVTSWLEPGDAFLLGRTTFELMRGYWPFVDDPDNLAAVKLNGLPKYVVSSTLTEPGWGDTTVLSGDVIEEVTRLKERPGGELQVHGSARLASTLHEAGHRLHAGRVARDEHGSRVLRAPSGVVRGGPGRADRGAGRGAAALRRPGG